KPAAGNAVEPDALRPFPRIEGDVIAGGTVEIRLDEASIVAQRGHAAHQALQMRTYQSCRRGHCSSRMLAEPATEVPHCKDLRNLKIICRMQASWISGARTAMASEGKRGTLTRRIRLEDVAAQCGVSVSTASRALANAKGVRPDLRATILETARRLNYTVPTSIAGRKVILAASSAAMLDYVRNQFTFYVLEVLAERAKSLGVEVVSRAIANTEEEAALLDDARADDGVVGCLFLTLDDESVLTLASDFDKPIVLVNGDDPE